MKKVTFFIQLCFGLVILSTDVFSAAFSVTSLADAGVGTLRAAITAANANGTATTGSPHTITFTGAGIGTITLASTLTITNHISINGGTLGTVIINGGNSAAIPQAFLFNAAACSGSVLRNLVINNCGVGPGVLINSPAVSVTVTNCRIGTNAAGNAAVRNIIGIEINGVADGGHTITNNLVSGNIQTGIWMKNTINNTISGNTVGLAADGVTVLANTGNGMFLDGSCNNNTIDQNIVSGNSASGIFLSRSSRNTITGNYCGTDKTGLLAKGNAWDGIGLVDGSNFNKIGGTTAAARNVCSAGTSSIASGIAIKSGGGAALASTNNVVLNNYCGVGSDGTTILGNTNYGIYLGYINASSNIIGKPGYGNLVANNANGAIFLENAGTLNNSIRGNSIYCNGPGTGAANINIGIALNAVANNNTAAPVINAASTNGNVYGSGLSAGDTVDVYYSDACRGCTYPNGKTYIGTAIANASGVWNYTGGVTVGSNITVTVTKYNASSLPGHTSQFSNCFVSIPLPVELLDFNVVANGQAAHLNWTTASETNNNYFEIQRSSDGFNFSTIGQVKGAGNSTAILNYNFVDNQPGNGIVYYRLKQVDFNGDYVYSSIRSVNIGATQKVLIYPNPINAGENINVELFTTSENSAVSIQVVDAVGKIVVSYSGVGHMHSINTTMLSKGMYLVLVKQVDSIVTTKVLIN